MSATAYEDLTPVEQLFAAFAGGELPLTKHSQALASSLIVYTGACYLTATQSVSTNAAAQYFQLFDQTTLPADGAIPAMVLTVSAASDKFLTWSLPGVFFRTGLVVCNSTTAATKTIGAADSFFHFSFIPVIWE